MVYNYQWQYFFGTSITVSYRSIMNQLVNGNTAPEPQQDLHVSSMLRVMVTSSDSSRDQSVMVSVSGQEL